MTLKWIMAFAACGLLAAHGASAQSNAVRTQAVLDTIANHAASGQACNLTFYWEIGNQSGKLASGTRGIGFGANTSMSIYSAGKWLYGAYVYQKKGGQLSDYDIQALTMHSGYSTSAACLIYTTVGSCQNAMGAQVAGHEDHYRYAGNHFQKHAASSLSDAVEPRPGLGLAALNKTQLKAELQSQLGADVQFSFDTPALASGYRATPTQYAVFLRKLLAGQLLLSGSALGAEAVCTYTGPDNTNTGRENCEGALYTPAATPPPESGEPDGGLDEDWDYSLGHWVENDPVWLASGGDAAYSSPGAAGFYPWIDSSRSYYGILARNFLSAASAGQSVQCGRLLRKAWLSGNAQ